MAQEPLALSFAKYLAGVGIHQATPETLHTIRSAFVDALGCTLLGSPHQAVATLSRSLGLISQPQDVVIIGRAQRCSLLDAVMLNGTASHADDYDDVVRAMAGHPTVPILPVILGLGELYNLSGRQIVDAYIVAFEAEARLGLVVQQHHYNKGWHPTGSLGIFGAAIAAGRLLQLDVEQTVTTLALCASMASGIKANFGTNTKPFHVGHASRSGLLAAMMVKEGFTANPQAFEHKQGFFAVYNGEGNYKVDRLLPTSLSEGLQVDSPEFGLKQFACCISTHGVILATLQAKEKYKVDPLQVSEIRIRAHPERLPHTDNPSPQSATASKFSTQYTAVRALLTGPPRLHHFEGDAFKEPEVVRLLAQTQVTASEELGSPFTFEVDLKLLDGTVCTGRVTEPGTRSVRNPMSEAELWEKFDDCTHSILKSDAAREIFDTAIHIDEVANVRTFAEMLYGGVKDGYRIVAAESSFE